MNEMMLFQTIAEATKAIADNPADAEAYKKRAVVLISMGQADEALKDLDALIDTLKSEDAEVYQLRGGIRMQKGDKEGALKDMQEAIRIKPELLEALNGNFKSAEGNSCH